MYKYNSTKVDDGIKKAMKQKYAVGKNVAQVKKALKKKNSGLLDKHKHNNYNTNELQNNQSNG